MAADSIRTDDAIFSRDGNTVLFPDGSQYVCTDKGWKQTKGAVLPPGRKPPVATGGGGGGGGGGKVPDPPLSKASVEQIAAELSRRGPYVLACLFANDGVEPYMNFNGDRISLKGMLQELEDTVGTIVDALTELNNDALLGRILPRQEDTDDDEQSAPTE